MKDGEEKKGASGGECYGTYNSTTEVGSGAGYVNNCIHSGSTEHSGGNTVWYNYVVASAGTIKNSSASDTTGNTIPATESVCPKGWTLPSEKQIDENTDTSKFPTVMGVYYYDSGLKYDSTYGRWWGNEASTGTKRYSLSYNGNLYTGAYYRSSGYYIRCVSEEKDVSDLTYMQDMTPSMTTRAAWNLCPK